jgi:hypothetical protein
MPPGDIWCNSFPRHCEAVIAPRSSFGWIQFVFWLAGQRTAGTPGSSLGLFCPRAAPVQDKAGQHRGRRARNQLEFEAKLVGGVSWRCQRNNNADEHHQEAYSGTRAETSRRQARRGASSSPGSPATGLGRWGGRRSRLQDFQEGCGDSGSALALFQALFDAG